MKKSIAGMELALADLPVGSKAKVVALGNDLCVRKKFADFGVVSGAEIAMQSYAPLGGLFRIKILDCSLALHRSEGEKIMVRVY